MDWMKSFCWFRVTMKCVKDVPKTTLAVVVSKEVCKAHSRGCNTGGNALRVVWCR